MTIFPALTRLDRLRRAGRPEPTTTMLGDWPVEVIDHVPPPKRDDVLLIAMLAACAAACALLLL